MTEKGWTRNPNGNDQKALIWERSVEASGPGGKWGGVSRGPGMRSGGPEDGRCGGLEETWEVAQPCSEKRQGKRRTAGLPEALPYSLVIAFVVSSEGTSSHRLASGASGGARRLDCGQVTDGAAIVFLASERKARKYADRRGRPLEQLARIEGWGHRSSHISFEPKLQKSRGQPYVFPHVRRAITEAYARAGVASPEALDGVEVHDCFTTTEYMAIDHLGLTAPGESWKAIEAGVIAPGGATPINPSGGLIGLGHPVGSTGVRMMLDCAKQVTGSAGGCQVEGARRFGMLNIGGSTTTTACFVVGAG